MAQVAQAISNGENLNKEIAKAIESGIFREAERIYDKQKEEAMKEFDRRKDEVLAGITLNIMKMIDMQYLGDRIVITLVTKEKNHE